MTKMADIETVASAVVTTRKTPQQPATKVSQVPLIVPHIGDWRPDASVTRENEIKLKQASARNIRHTERQQRLEENSMLPLSPTNTPAPLAPPTNSAASHPSTLALAPTSTPLNPVGPMPCEVYPHHMTKEVRKVIPPNTANGTLRPKGFVSQYQRHLATMQDIEEARSRNGFEALSKRAYSTYTLHPRESRLTVSASNVKLGTRKESRESSDVMRATQHSTGSEAINYRNINLKRFYDSLDYGPTRSEFDITSPLPAPRISHRATRKGVLKTGKLASSNSRQLLPKQRDLHRTGNIKNALEEMMTKGPAVNVERVLAFRLYNDLENLRRTKSLLHTPPPFVPHAGSLRLPGDPTPGELALENKKKELARTASLSRRSTASKAQSEPIFPSLSSMRFISTSRDSQTPVNDDQEDMPDVRRRSPDSVIRAVRSSNVSFKNGPSSASPDQMMREQHKPKIITIRHLDEVGAS